MTRRSALQSAGVPTANAAAGIIVPPDDSGWSVCRFSQLGFRITALSGRELACGTGETV